MVNVADYLANLVVSVVNPLVAKAEFVKNSTYLQLEALIPGETVIVVSMFRKGYRVIARLLYTVLGLGIRRFGK